MRVTRWPLPALLVTLAGCTTQHVPVIVAEAPPPVVLAAAPLPPGASPGMLVPQALPDGSFPTPNQGLAGAAAVWHLRAGLNVAALSCPGEEGAAIRAGYNAWLTRDRKTLARTVTVYAASYASAATYDDAMTRLYNFFSQTPVRPAFCSAAASVAADLATLDPVAQPEVAATRLALLDRPFTDFYRAYAAWRDGTPARPVDRAVIAVAAVTPAAPPARVAASTPPRLVLDLSTLPADGEVIAHR